MQDQESESAKEGKNDDEKEEKVNYTEGLYKKII